MAIFKFYQIFRCIKEELGEQKAKQLFYEYETLPDKMSADEQAKLASKIMDRLDNSLDAETVKRIRYKHPCNIPKEYDDEINELIEKYSSVEKRIEEYVKWDKKSMSISNEENSIIISWGLPKCVCEMFSKLNEYEPISKSWCECCNAHNAKIFSKLCGKKVESELIEGIACGGKDCIFRISNYK